MRSMHYVVVWGFGVLESYHEKTEVKNPQINQRMMVCGVFKNYLRILVIKIKT